MTKNMFLAAAVLPFMWLAGASTQPPPAEGQKLDEDKPRVFDLKGLLEDKPRRVNGLLLSLEAEQVADDRSDRIRVTWMLDYKGPRWPLIIFAPSLTHETAGRTSLLFFATGRSGTTYAYELQNPPPSPINPTLRPISKEDWFERVQKNGMGGTGDIVIVTADLKRYFTRKLPQEFDPAKPPALHVQMYHSARERGEHLQLDAWTGDLISATIRVDLKEW